MIAAIGESAEAEEGGARVIPLADRALLERHRAGEPEAFAALVGAFRAPIYGYLTRCGVQSSERDDVFQEVFLAVHRAAREAAPPGPVAPWIFAIAVNAVRSHYRKARVRAIVRPEQPGDENVAHRAPGPDRELEAQRTAAWLDAQIARLPLEQREALLLCAVDGLELRDAAEAIGAPVETVKTRLRRARLALAEARARLERREASEEGAR
jgi:RNA polymerase sigma-70 factor (ECF subfamily)